MRFNGSPKKPTLRVMYLRPSLHILELIQNPKRLTADTSYQNRGEGVVAG